LLGLLFPTVFLLPSRISPRRIPSWCPQLAMYPCPPMRLSALGYSPPSLSTEQDRRCLNSELWHACAGPLVSLPSVSSRVVYFPQGHTEQVAASTQKELDSHIPNYPNLPSWLICLLDNVTLHVQMDRPPFLSTGLSCNFVAFLLSAKHTSLQSLACNYQ
jgi:hypothetical protein